jgi:mannosyltransferase OCH1-like enzyme
MENLHEAGQSAAAPRRKPKLTLPAWPASDGIPRIIHQTFHTRRLPPELEDSLRAIRRANPDWSHRFYDDAEIRRFIDERYGPAALDYFDAINPSYRAARADLFRYLVIYAEGGVYLDAKSQPTRPLSEVIRPDDRYLISQWDNGPDGAYPGWGLHPELARTPGGEFQQWYIAAAAGHPFLRAVLERVLGNLRTYNPGLHGVGQRGVLRVTGPIAYTRAIQPLLERHPHRVVDSRADLGFAYSIYGKEGHKQVFGGHYSELREPITPVGATTRAAGSVIASLKRIRRAALGLPTDPGAQAV